MPWTSSTPLPLTNTEKEWTDFRKLFGPILLTKEGTGVTKFKLNLIIYPGRLPQYAAEIEFHRLIEKRRSF